MTLAESPARTDAAAQPVQPLLNDAVIALRAPTQVWSDRSGDLAGSAIHGVYHGDVRHVRSLVLSCDASEIEWISMAPDGPSRVVFTGLLRGLDDTWPDPRVRIVRDRRVSDGRVEEAWEIRSRVAHAVSTTLSLRVVAEFALLHEIK
jgi:hypothetical protein